MIFVENDFYLMGERINLSKSLFMLIIVNELVVHCIDKYPWTWRVWRTKHYINRLHIEASQYRFSKF